MKKLMLFLGAISLVSANIYAKEILPVPEQAPVEEEVVVMATEPVSYAPALRVTNIGQYLEIDNTSGEENIGEGVHFGNFVNLAYGDDWTFDFMARKTWSASTDDYFVDGVKHSDGMKSNGHRIELQATRHFDNNFALGLKWRGEEDLDRLYIPIYYQFGMISGWATPAYTFYNQDSQNNDNDAFYLEAEPIQISYGPLQFAYYFEGEKYTGDVGPSYEDHWYNHQARVRGTFYSSDVLSLGAEYRYQFASEYESYNDKGAREYYENKEHTVILNAAYKLTENLTINGYYQYEFHKYDKQENINKDDDYYGEFCVGWNYAF